MFSRLTRSLVRTGKKPSQMVSIYLSDASLDFEKIAEMLVFMDFRHSPITWVVYGVKYAASTHRNSTAP